VFADSFINNESREILPMEVFAGTCVRMVQDRVVLDTESYALSNKKALATVLNTVSTTKKVVYIYTFAKYC
jgi:hypothetical protein